MMAMDCKTFEERYWLKTYGEPIPGGNAALEEHLKSCSACQAKREEIDRMQALLSLRTAEVPTQEALQRSRNLLSARLDAQRDPANLAWTWKNAWENVQDWLSSGWQPALALSMLIIGVMFGRLLIVPDIQPNTNVMQPAPLDYTTWENQYLQENVLNEDARISDVRVKPLKDQPGLVQVSFQGTKEYTLTGNPDDTMIRDLLTWTVKNDQNSGVRLRSVEELAKVSGLSSQAQSALAFPESGYVLSMLWQPPRKTVKQNRRF